VYLAGPEVFLSDAVAAGERKKAICAEAGLTGVYPIDAQVDVSELAPRDAAFAISALNEELIRSCVAVIANITPFRGVSADVGTVYEMGFAAGLGKWVFAYTNVAEPFTSRTARALGLKLPKRLGGELRDRDGMLVENWGLADNLMLEGGLAQCGGRLVVGNAPADERFTCLRAFRECVALLAAVLRTPALARAEEYGRGGAL
jgi:nucleoside 2-deoxyribosyltransferase